MKHPTAPTRRPPPLTRGFQRSRLEEDLLTAAYALVLPVLRRPLPAGRTQGRRTAPAQHEHSNRFEGELRA